MALNAARTICRGPDERNSDHRGDVQSNDMTTRIAAIKRGILPYMRVGDAETIYEPHYVPPQDVRAQPLDAHWVKHKDVRVVF